MQPAQNGYSQSLQQSPQLMQFTPQKKQETPVARSLLPQMNETVVVNTHLAPSQPSNPSGVSPPLTGASRQLVMSLNDDFRAGKVAKVLDEIGDAAEQEILAALQATGWNTAAAVEQIPKDRKVKIESLIRYVFFVFG